MKVTIAIPHFRSEESLGFLLHSLNKQRTKLDTKKEVEIIIVNDEEKNISISDNFERLNLKIISQKHQGPAVARNTALREAGGEFIFYLDSDSIPRIDWLENLYSAFIKNSRVDSIGGRVIPSERRGYANEHFNLVNDLEKPKMKKDTSEIVSIITANCGFKTAALRSIGGFNEDAFRFVFPGGEDMDVSYRLMSKNCHFAYEPSAIVEHFYPQGILSFVKKYKNYGVGLRRHIEFNNINPGVINQPPLSPYFFLPYFFRMPLSLGKFVKKMCQNQSFIKILMHSFFFSIRYISFGYGYFIKGKYNPKFNNEFKN